MSKTHPLAPYLPTIPPPTTSNTAEGLEPLSYEVDPNSDGKAVYNPPREGKSPYYDTLWHKGGEKTWVDIHIYHQPGNPNHVAHAHKLYEAVRREFPEVRAYRFFDGPLGPHPIPMFELNVFTPHQLGAVVSWLMANRGPCSVLIHPNTSDEVADHTEHATWMGQPVPLDVDLLRALEAKKAEARK